MTNEIKGPAALAEEYWTKCKWCMRKKPSWCKRHSPKSTFKKVRYYSQEYLDKKLKEQKDSIFADINIAKFIYDEKTRRIIEGWVILLLEFLQEKYK